MEIAVREFRREDFETLWRTDQECFEPGIAYSRLELGAYIRRRGTFTLVAEAAVDGDGEGGGRVLGFIVAQATRAGAGHVITIDVPASSRRLGIGSKLLVEAENRLRRAGCHRVGLETAVDNLAALAFYERHRYSVVKTIPQYYSNGVDAFVLEKEF